MLMGNFQSRVDIEPELHDFINKCYKYGEHTLDREPFEQYMSKKGQKVYGKIPKQLNNIKNIIREDGLTIELNSNWNGFAIVVIEYRLIGGYEICKIVFKNGKGSIQKPYTYQFMPKYYEVKYPGEECKVCLLSKEGMSVYKLNRDEKIVRELEKCRWSRYSKTIAGEIERIIALKDGFPITRTEPTINAVLRKMQYENSIKRIFDYRLMKTSDW